MTVVINSVSNSCEREIVSNNIKDVYDSSFDLNSEALPENIEGLHLNNQTISEIISMRIKNEIQNDEYQMTKEEREHYTNLLKFKFNYLKVLISLLLCFLFSSLLTQILHVTQTFNIFSEYQNSPEFKLFILVSVLLIYSISGINCILFVLYSNSLRTYSFELLNSILQKILNAKNIILSLA